MYNPIFESCDYHMFSPDHAVTSNSNTPVEFTLPALRSKSVYRYLLRTNQHVKSFSKGYNFFLFILELIKWSCLYQLSF